MLKQSTIEEKTTLQVMRFKKPIVQLIGFKDKQNPQYAVLGL